jgi:hypothetical protein
MPLRVDAHSMRIARNCECVHVVQRSRDSEREFAHSAEARAIRDARNAVLCEY